MRIIFLWLMVLDLLLTSFLTGGSDICEPIDADKDYSWESTQKKIKEAGDETQVLQATEVFRNTCLDNATEVFHDMAQFFCGITLTRMGIDKVYMRDIHPNISSSAIDVNTATKDWRDFMRGNDTDGLASRIREAYKFIIRMDDNYTEEFVSSVPRTADLCRRYEPKIPELQTTYTTQLQSGSRLSLADILQNHTDWSMVMDDLYAINRVREAENLVHISWAWLDEENKKIVPFCPNK